MRTLTGWAAAVGLWVVALIPGAAAALPVSQLAATARDGQVFLTWREAETPPGTTLNVYVSERPISDPAQATLAAHHIQPHSARDWWEDPASFTKGKPAGKPLGFIIDDSGRRLDPAGGLLVYTVPGDAKGRLFFAVTASDANGREDRQIAASVNALGEGVAARPGPIKPIWQRPGRLPAPGAGRGKALWLSLHAKSGVVADMEYLVFGDQTMGWRMGLPCKFSVRISGDEVVVRPTDRVWINRPHDEAGDGGAPAIWTFWYGYNSKIYDRKLMTQGVPVNYTERLNLWILGWVRDYYQPDANRWYCSGSSMGGCGTISFGLRHPELFAGLHAHVPIVSYTYLGRGSAHRFEPCCWMGTIPETLKTDEGLPFLEHLNGTKFVRECRDDLPPVLLVNGRTDGSIPWENNPPFYRALNDAHQAFAVYWDNGDHPTCGKNAPDDVKGWLTRFRRFRRDQSYPAFSNTSSNRNPGNGKANDGDLVGWMNRGMDWREVNDRAGQYSITLLADYPGVSYPVRTDVTLRRLQAFKPAAGEKLLVETDDGQRLAATADGQGPITLPAVSIASKQGTRIVIRRKAEGRSS